METSVVVALGQHLAARQHGDAVGEVGDDREIVLDHQDGAVGRDPPDQRRDALDVLLRHAGHRLVEQQHFGLERQRRRDLQRALAAIGEFARRSRRQSSERPTSSMRVQRLGVELRAAAVSRAPEIEAVAALAPLQRDADILEHASAAGNTAEIWNERTRPEPRDVGRPSCR